MIDLYQIHYPVPYLSQKRLLQYMEALVKEGFIRHIGVSNFSQKQLEQAQCALKSEEIVSNQVKYNILQHQIESRLLSYTKKEHITLIAFSPLAQGILSGKYRDRGPKGTRRTNRLFAPINRKRISPILNELTQIASDHNTTSTQVALSWVIRDPSVIAIPGAKSIKQLTNNIEAVNLTLTQKELQRLENVSKTFKPAKLRSTLWAIRSAIINQ